MQHGGLTQIKTPEANIWADLFHYVLFQEVSQKFSPRIYTQIRGLLNGKKLV